MTKRRAKTAVGEQVAPVDLVASELEIGARRLLVLSFPIDASRAPFDRGRFAALTATEHEVALLLLEGKSNAVIAKARRTSARTVANQVASILRKLGVDSRRELWSSAKEP